MLVTNVPTTSIGASIGGNWKTMLVEIGLSVAENVISNYVKERIDASSKDSTNKRVSRHKAWEYTFGQYRSRRRKFFQTYNLRYKRRGKRNFRRSSNYSSRRSNR